MIRLLAWDLARCTLDTDTGFHSSRLTALLCSRDRRTPAWHWTREAGSHGSQWQSIYRLCSLHWMTLVLRSFGWTPSCPGSTQTYSSALVCGTWVLRFHLPCYPTTVLHPVSKHQHRSCLPASKCLWIRKSHHRLNLFDSRVFLAPNDDDHR